VDYEDRISIATPEGVALDLTLAGLGSRSIAFLIDQAIGWAGILAVYLFLALVAGDSDIAGLAIAIGLVLLFLLFFGYHVIFETLAAGRTPGKRITGIRVVNETGAPIGFVTSSLRNIVRLVDALPGTYLVGMIAVLASRRNQRLGDMAAGTLVVRDRRGSTVMPAAIDAVPFVSTWDLAAITADDIAAVRRFLARRESLTAPARQRIGLELAEVLRAKVVGPDDDLEPEAFLEALVATKAARG
jgi:uncharacterized RDD family membrane protein YckC